MKYERFIGLLFCICFVTMMLLGGIWGGIHTVLNSSAEWYWKLAIYQLLGMAIWKLPKSFIEVMKDLLETGYDEADHNAE